MSQTSTSDTPFDQDAADDQPQDAAVGPLAQEGAPEPSPACRSSEEAVASSEHAADEKGVAGSGHAASEEGAAGSTGVADELDRASQIDGNQGADSVNELPSAEPDEATDTVTESPSGTNGGTEAADTAASELYSRDLEANDNDSVPALLTDGEARDDADEASEGSTRRSRQAPSRELLEKEGEIAADFLETLLDICDLDGDIDVDIDGDRAAVSIVDSEEGRVPRRLVGTDGKVLDALQELTRLAVYSQTGERSRLILDIASHRAQRRGTLVQIAQDAISKVKESGTEQPLSPMSAFERKIVHDEVLAAGLRSESDGAEPRRYVVVLPG